MLSVMASRMSCLRETARQGRPRFVRAFLYLSIYRLLPLTLIGTSTKLHGHPCHYGAVVHPTGWLESLPARGGLFATRYPIILRRTTVRYGTLTWPGARAALTGRQVGA